MADRRHQAKARLKSRSGKKNRFIKRKTFRYAVIELADYADVREFERQLKRKLSPMRTLNVSPASGKGKPFSDESEENWLKYRKSIRNKEYSDGKSDEPHWWYISGHHAGFGDGKLYGEWGDYGFFNDPYYAAYKKYLYHQKAFPGKIAKAVFMTMSRKISNGLALAVQRESNPLYAKGTLPECNGLFLIGCNTLTSFYVREMLSKVFPGALVFGYFWAKAPGAASQQRRHIRGIFSAIRKTTPSLFENPEKHFDLRDGEEDTLVSIVSKLSLITRKRRQCIHFRHTLYIPEYLWDHRHWFHIQAYEKYLKTTGSLYIGESMVVCPVRGKKNPFKYSDDGLYISGLRKGIRNARIVKHFVYTEFGSLAGFKRFNVYLVIVLNHVRIEADSPVNLTSIAADGDSFEFTCTASEKVHKLEKILLKDYSVEIVEIESGKFVIRKK